MTEYAMNQVCYRTLGVDDPASLAHYESLGGYTTLKKIIAGELSPEDVIEQVKASGLRGRGGAGFPTGLKWSFVNRDKPGEKYLLCNADESEPGTFKDHDILRYNPHQLIEGIAIACHAIGAQNGYCFMRGEFYEPYLCIEKALAEARAAGYLDVTVKSTGLNVNVHSHRTAGAYICGEETALLNSLEGKRAMPRIKPPFPANFGLYGCPSNINNAETLCSVPVILEKGAQWFAKLGTEKSGGTKIFSISGHVNKPGNYELPMGIPFADLLDIAGGVRDGHTLKAVIPGGSSMPVLPADIIMKTNMDFESVSAAGSLLGSAGVMVMDETTCMVKFLTRLVAFYKHESCGQCTPCREGSGWVLRMLQDVLNGEASLDDLDKLVNVAENIAGRTICVLGDSITMPVVSFLKHFRGEFEYFVKNKKSMVEA